MRQGARTPEDLETQLEDALVLESRDDLAELFEEGAVMALGAGDRVIRGASEISRLAGGIWTGQNTYLADPGRVMQARDLGLVVTPRGVNVVRRGSDGSWRYVILVVDTDELDERSEG
jgi:hypothetical protein